MDPANCAKRRKKPLEPLVFCALVLTAACGTGTEQIEQVDQAPAEKVREKVSGQFVRLDLPPIEDNIRNDTLVINTTHALIDGTFIMAARNVAETFEGLRLYRYELLPDSNARILATSAPAYDSWRLLPTFFASHVEAMPEYILAEFGEKESWGSKLFQFDDAGFTDLGYLDVAYRDHTTDEITGKPKIVLRTASDKVVMSTPSADRLLIHFDVDSIFLFDDGMGNIDVNVDASKVHYMHSADGLQLVIATSPA